MPKDTEGAGAKVAAVGRNRDLRDRARRGSRTAGHSSCDPAAGRPGLAQLLDGCGADVISTTPVAAIAIASAWIAVNGSPRMNTPTAVAAMGSATVKTPAWFAGTCLSPATHIRRQQACRKRIEDQQGPERRRNRAQVVARELPQAEWGDQYQPQRLINAETRSGARVAASRLATMT